MERPETSRLSGNPVLRRLKNNRNTIFGTVSLVGGITSTIVATSPKDEEGLRKTSVIIYLVLAVVQALQTLLQIKNEQTRESLLYYMR